MATAEQLKNLGNESFRKNDLAGAISHYSQAIELDPSLTACFSNRAQCYIKLGKFAEAARDCQLGIDSLQSGIGDVKLATKLYFRLAQSRKELSDLSAAREAYETARDLAPEGSKERDNIEAELSTLQWGERRAKRESKFSMYNRHTAPSRVVLNESVLSGGDDEAAAATTPVQVVDELPPHLRRKTRQVLTGTFRPPGKLTNFAFTQLMRASTGDLPAIYEYIFTTLSERPAQLANTVFKLGGVNYDAIDFIFDAILSVKPKLSDQEWASKSIDIVRGAADCPRFSTVKLFVDSKRIAQLKSANSELEACLNELF